MAVKKQEAAVQDTAEKTEAVLENAQAEKDTEIVLENAQAEKDTEIVLENAQAEKDTEIVHLFKDGHRYSEPVFVGVNGETYLIQRGVDVEVPKAIAEVLRHSEEMDNAAAEKIAAAEAAAVQQAQRV